ncbi:MAG TPA: asparagine--tRNA ligase [Clostridiales bacterium]|jgi:asparaginyl-tRNA synthetase|nr:asparagine--tRNA ligase [Clostridiales bacterium]
MVRTDLHELRGSAELYSGKEVTVAGWVRNIRASNAFGFIELNDGSTFSCLQIVIEESKLSNYNDIASLNIGAAIIAKGIFTLTPGAKQPYELKATEVTVEGASDPEYPIQNKRHTREYLRSLAHLRPRTNTFNAVFRVRSAAAFAIHEFFNKRGYMYIHTPIITTSDCEGAGEMFRVTTLDVNDPPRLESGEIDWSQDFFGAEAFLTVSGQLNGEALAQAFGKIYTFGPTFRAENSNTPRHAAEFWMIEPEIAFADLADEMQLSEDLVKYIINYVMENCSEEIEFFNRWNDKELIKKLNNVVSSEFVRVSYTEAIEILQKAKESGVSFKYPLGWGEDLATEHERYLTEQHYKKPVFVTDWPREIKSFYMRLNDDGKTVAAADMLVPGVGELCGGSQREERLDILEDNIKRLGMDVENYRWYNDLRRWGGTHHAGFGLGFERMIMYITGMDNIRDVSLFPRTTGSAAF